MVHNYGHPMSIADELKQLKELHEGGALTTEEFAQAKAEVLKQSPQVNGPEKNKRHTVDDNTEELNPKPEKTKAGEVVYFDQENVKITSNRLVANGETYSVPNITSFRGAEVHYIKIGPLSFRFPFFFFKAGEHVLPFPCSVNIIRRALWVMTFLPWIIAVGWFCIATFNPEDEFTRGERLGVLIAACLAFVFAFWLSGWMKRNPVQDWIEYKLILVTAGGELRAYQAKEAEFFDQISAALDKALAEQN
jgi:hypothetical protein